MLLIAWLVGFGLCVLAILLMPLFHKKNGSKLALVMLFVLGFVTFAGSGFLHWAGYETKIPEKSNTVDTQKTNTDTTDGEDKSIQDTDGIRLGDTVIPFELHPVTSGTGDNYLFDIAVGETTKSVIENVSSDDLTNFMNSLDFTGTNGNAVLMFEDGTGLQMIQGSCTVYADYGYIDVSENEFTMVDRLGSIWNDTGEGWYYTTLQEMREADQSATISNRESSGTLGEYFVEIKDAVISTTRDGESAIVITYSWTNNSEETTSAEVAFMERAFQYGIQLDSVYDSSMYDTDLSFKNLRPGASLDVQCAFLVTDENAIIEFELSEWISLSDDSVTKNFDPTQLG